MGAVVGILLTLLPPIAKWENDWGGEWLFRLRGPRQPPPEVAIVAMSKDATQALGHVDGDGEGRDPRRWPFLPRLTHARLVRALSQAGARVIVFDIRFLNPSQPEQDQALTQAIREAGNVVLPVGTPPERGDHNPVPLLPELALAAAATAPFTLPKSPVKVSQAWLFEPRYHNAPSLPMAALQVFARPALAGQAGEWLAREMAGCPASIPELENGETLIRRLPRFFKDCPARAARLLPALETQRERFDPRDFRVLAALLSAYAGPVQRYLDFYGYLGAIPTYPLDAMVRSGPNALPDLRGKAVFVGFSEGDAHRQGHEDCFFTVFTSASNSHLCGVEIAATLFANLLERRHTQPLPLSARLLVALLWGLACGGLLSLPRGYWLAGGLALGYLALAHALFSRTGLWLPLVTPLLFQLPVMAALAKPPPPARRHFAICLSTDAIGYTRFAETRTPEQIEMFLRAYHRLLSETVERHGGRVMDIRGDGMMAVWTGRESADHHEIHRQACTAALEIQARLRRGGTDLFRTRIGLHCGQIMLVPIPAGRHDEFRAIGDVVNTTARLDQLNRKLGTQILVSEEAVVKAPEIVSRKLGCFRVHGRSALLLIHELVCRAVDFDKPMQTRLEAFARGLALFQEQRWQEAQLQFQTIIAYYGEDGPSRFYIEVCERHLRAPPAAWDGTLTME
jgi:adenylate cyclase